MSGYVAFRAQDGEAILVEIDSGAIPPPGAVAKGLGDRAGGAVATAHAALDEALRRAVCVNAEAVLQAVRALPHPPDQVEVAFGLKVTGEAGLFAVCKAGGEANYAVTLTWRGPGDP